MISTLCFTLGACLTPDALEFRLYSQNATRVEVCFFEKPLGESEKQCIALQTIPSQPGLWQTRFPRPQSLPLYYGYRLWGPNWPYQSSWRPGRLDGFIAEVDQLGNRFNPNKLVFDPYTPDLSHGLEAVNDLAVFDPRERALDSGRWAPKAIVMEDSSPRRKKRSPPRRNFKDEVIYEVHVKGFTAADSSLPAAYRGTYKGAAMKAAYLRDLGITAVEFLPVQQKANHSSSPNYWGYMTLAYFVPERSYAFDQSVGGPAREFAEMVDEFHRQGIKVYIDVVYNHTAEGGLPIYSFRGIDNRLYYDLSPSDPRYANDHTGCGANFAVYKAPVREFILESLGYWHEHLGVDGFRFDLASVMGNVPRHGQFHFDATDPNSILNRAPELWPDVDWIAEPWAIGDGTFQLGRFPAPWAEWNGVGFRDLWRKLINLRGVDDVNLGSMADSISGSNSIFTSRGPANSINFLTAHDGFTLHDLFRYNHKVNQQPWPYGPSDGGEDHNRSWDQGGDSTRQRQVTRLAFVALALSAGTPMLSGGDEFARTLRGNNNPYNLDSSANYLPWTQLASEHKLHGLVRRLLKLRAQHSALRPEKFFTGIDVDRNGIKDITWLDARGAEFKQWNSTDGFLAYRLELNEPDVRSLFVVYNLNFSGIRVELPSTSRGSKWFRVIDTAPWFESEGGFHGEGAEAQISSTYYDLAERSALVLIEKSSP